LWPVAVGVEELAVALPLCQTHKARPPGRNDRPQLCHALLLVRSDSAFFAACRATFACAQRSVRHSATPMVVRSPRSKTAQIAGSVPVNPEAIAAGFVARQHWGVCGQIKAELGLLDLVPDETGAASGNGPDPRRLARADCERQLPDAPAQLKSHIEHRGRRRGRMNCVSR
jgi:hypothetical protein